MEANERLALVRNHALHNRRRRGRLHLPDPWPDELELAEAFLIPQERSEADGYRSTIKEI